LGVEWLVQAIDRSVQMQRHERGSARDERDGACTLVRAQPLHELEPVNVGHHDVDERHARPVQLREQAPRGLAAVGFENVESFVAQDVDHHVSDHCIVINDYDFFLHSRTMAKAGALDKTMNHATPVMA
jgi:hypothetical protein